MTIENVFPRGIDTHNIPPIPQHVWDKFEKYRKAVQPNNTFAFEHPANAGQHPYGLYYLTVPEGQTTAEVHYASDPDAQRQQITKVTGNGTGRTIAQWTPIPGDYDDKGQWRQGGALFLMDDNGEEAWGIHRFLPGKDGSYQIERWTPKKTRNQAVVLSHKEDKYAYSSNVGNGIDTNVYIRDLKAPVSGTDGRDDTGICVLPAKGVFGAMDFSLDDKYLLVQQYIQITNCPAFIVSTDGSQQCEQIILPWKGPDGKEIMDESDNVKAAQVIRYARFSITDPNLVYMVTDWMSDVNSLISYNMKTKEITPITTPSVSGSVFPISWEVEMTALTKRHLAFVVNENGYSVLYCMDLESNKVSKVDFPQGIPQGVIPKIMFPKKSAERGLPDMLSVEVDSVMSPGTVYLLNVDTGDWQTYRATAMSRPEYDVSQQRLIHWKSFDGLPISAFVQFPPQYYVSGDLSTFQPDQKLPVVIFIHGGPEGQYRPSFNPRLYLQYLCNELGCVVICPNVRGSSGYGQKFVSLDDQEKREDSVKDIGALIDYITTSVPSIDPSKISVMGRSYGGYMVFACMIHFRDRLKCGVETCGVTHFVNFMETTAEYRRDLRRVEYGDERIPEMREFMHKISPLTRAHEINKPIFMSQGKNDTRVPYTEFLKMKAKLVEANGDNKVWWMACDNEGHIFRQRWVSECNVVGMYMFLSHFLLERDP
ncbi:hypothetical protein BZG36_01733 [Bifiguratus adelaidae]|uniref:Prolyl endopeptidase n=1 Tax=Bifiguratus adelaidae TaxID=1938954 RepID=A0A261Y2Z8_9FUNG|nr:hypothetical protein BZG36_01733 [Bifiguratus adelaidae]